MQSIDLAVRDAMEASEAATLKERITKHRDVFFSPVTEKYFAFAMDQRADSDSARKTFKDFATVLDKCRAEGIDAVFLPAPAPVSSPAPETPATGNSAGGKSLDSRVIGYWRHMEPISGFTTDTHCVYDGSGRFEWWSVSVSTFGRSESPREYGAWHVSDQLLHLVFEDGTLMEADYILDSSSMVWRNHGRYRFWTRIN